MTTTFVEVALRPDNLPVLLLLPGFIGVFWWWRREAGRNDRLEAEGGLEGVAEAMRGPVPPRRRDLGLEDPDRAHTWPHLLRVELLATLAVLVLLLVWSITIDAPLEQEADPNRTPNPSKAPWYFVGLQEMLVYFDAWIAGVVLPGLIILGLAAIPYLDVNPGGEGYYAWRPRRFALSVFWAGLGLWIVLILVGALLRGPGWGWFWPWEPWDPHQVHARPSRNWSDVLGIPEGTPAFLFGGLSVLAYYGLALVAWLRVRRRPGMVELGSTRFFIVAFLGLTFLALPLKIILRHTLDVKYVWVTPWFNL